MGVGQADLEVRPMELKSNQFLDMSSICPLALLMGLCNTRGYFESVMVLGGFTTLRASKGN